MAKSQSKPEPVVGPTPSDGPVPGARVVSFTVPNPGFIPHGVIVDGVQPQLPYIGGPAFIPGPKKAAEVAPEVIATEPLEEVAPVVPVEAPVEAPVVEEKPAPEPKKAAPAAEKKPAEFVAGVCDECGKDFRKKADPIKSVQAHKNFVHKTKKG